MMNNRTNDDATRPLGARHQPTASIPSPSEPKDVDALLAESLKAQSEMDFTWKEPERKPRWWQRAEMQQHSSVYSSGPTTPVGPSSVYPRTTDREKPGIRTGTMVFGVICLLLAMWVIASVVFSVSVDPITVALVICTLAGLTLVAAGLKPKPGQRI